MSVAAFLLSVIPVCRKLPAVCFWSNWVKCDNDKKKFETPPGPLSCLTHCTDGSKRCWRWIRATGAWTSMMLLWIDLIGNSNPLLTQEKTRSTFNLFGASFVRTCRRQRFSSHPVGLPVSKTQSYEIPCPLRTYIHVISVAPWTIMFAGTLPNIGWKLHLKEKHEEAKLGGGWWKSWQNTLR